MDDNDSYISSERWKVVAQSIDQIWKAVNDLMTIKSIFLQMQFSFLDNENLDLKEINQTSNEYCRQILWEIQHESKMRLSFEVIPNTLDNNNLLHVILSCLSPKNEKNDSINSKELSCKCEKFLDFLSSLLLGKKYTITNYESIYINCHIKDLYRFITSWKFSKVPHSLIKEVKLIEKKPHKLNAIIQCTCFNGSNHLYQVVEVENNLNQLTMKYNVKEIIQAGRDNISQTTDTISGDTESDQIKFTLCKGVQNHSFLSVEHVLNSKNNEFCLNEKCLSNLTNSKKQMLIEIKKFLEERANINIKNSSLREKIK